jgi:cytochrome c oxidase subunit 4
MAGQQHTAGGHGHGDDHVHVMSLQTNLLVFAALMALLVVTVAAAYAIHGPLGLVVAMLIASVKAALILLYFMHIKYSSKLQAIFATSAFFWLAIMILITMSDYLTRGWTGMGGK